MKVVLILALFIESSVVWCCCVPKQNEVTMETFMAGTSMEGTCKLRYDKNQVKLFYDEVNLKTAIVPPDNSFRSISDYANGTFYFINETTKSCTAYSQKLSFPSLCFDTWTKMGTEYYGGGTSKLWVEKYVCSAGGENVFATVEQTNCAPISVNVIVLPRPDISDFVEWMAFTNLTVGIKDPTVFDPPPHCNKTATEFQALTVFRRFHHLARSCGPF